TVADLAGVAEHARATVGLQRGVRRIKRPDRRRDGIRAVNRSQQDPRRAWILQFNEVRLVLDIEGAAEASREGGTGIRPLDAGLADGRMSQEAAPEQRVVLGLDGAALATALDALGATAAGAVQSQPMAAGLEPALERAALPGIGIRSGDVGDQQA